MANGVITGQTKPLKSIAGGALNASLSVDLSKYSEFCFVLYPLGYGTPIYICSAVFPNVVVANGVTLAVGVGGVLNTPEGKGILATIAIGNNTVTMTNCLYDGSPSSAAIIEVHGREY